MANPNLEGLSIHEEEEEGFCFDFDEEGEEQVNLQWCLVGRFLCERPIHFKSMRIRMADLWRPVRGVTIKEAKPGLFLFSFAHPLDMEGVLNGGPWTFDNNMLLLERAHLGVQIENIPLFHADFWVQVHNLPTGLMKESVGVKLANYIGTFLEYDKNNKTSFWSQYMRLRVKVDVRQPLKKDTKVKDRAGEWCTVNFKYEKLGVFCFVCGLMGHAENKCLVRYSMENDDGKREWSGEIRADPRRGGGRQTSRWLREERDGGEGSSGGGRRERGGPAMESTGMGHVHADVASSTQHRSSHVNGALITIEEASMALIDQQPNNNQIIPTNSITPPFETVQNIHSNSLQSLPAKTEKIPPFISLNSATVMSTNYCQLLSTQGQPSSHVFFPNNQINPSLSLNNIPIFNSQLNPSIPLNIKNGKQLMTHKTQPTRKLTRPVTDMTRTQLAPNPTGPVLNQPRPDPITQQDQMNRPAVADMEIQTEKKRRREEKNCSDKNEEAANQHFLSAGPGSQDCREQ
jgi:14-3-3 protein epsilon